MKSINSIDRDRPKFFVDRLPDILGELSYAEENNCLKIVYQSTIFFIHLNQGQLVYATNSVAPFERLERHLRRLSNQNPQITNSTIKQPRQQFTNDLQAYDSLPTDYQSILWLVEVGHLTTEEAIALIRRITREVFESFLCLPNLNSFKLIPRSNQIEELCRFDLHSYIEQCRKRIKAWDAFDKISSSYQRPYLLSAQDYKISGLSTQQNETICKLLKGLNFRQISAVIDLDELVVAKILYPSIENSTVILRDPKTPFNLLPSFPQQQNIFEGSDNSAWRGEDSGFLQVNSHSKQTAMALENTKKIAYVDRDVSAQKTLAECLEQNLFNTLAIANAMGAFAKLIEFQPDLIFVTADLPDIDGYELCTLLRNHQDFHALPIIIVSDNSDSVDEARSKKAGATSNIAKPLERAEVLTTIWQYLQ